LKRGSGFDQGCERFDETSVVGEQAESSEHVTDVALAELAAAREPFFAFVHYFDPHSDYLDHLDFPWADGYRGWLREQMAFDGLVRNRHAIDAADLAYLLDTYDEEIAHTDRQIGRLLDELDRRDAWKDTLVLFVVDHGEEFLEHGNFGHTVTVYEELVHVPLIVVPRGSASGSRYSGVVEARDAFATVLDELDLDFGASVRERSLLRTAREAPKTGARAFTITWPTDAPVSSGQRHFVTGLRDGSWKLIHDWTREKVMLFDLAADPGERNDLSASRPDVADPLRAALDAWVVEQRKRDTGAARRKLDADERRMLQALGYAGSDE
jgi:arylsulfatase A-like enzyme